MKINQTQLLKRNWTRRAIRVGVRGTLDIRFKNSDRVACYRIDEDGLSFDGFDS
jgi:hypothetical protein